MTPKYRLVVGKFELSIISVPEGSKPPFIDAQHIWIRHCSGDREGEGMSVRTSKLEAMIAKFYEENF